MTMEQKSIAYQKYASNVFLFRLGMLRKLPSVVFWGIKIKSLDESRCEVTIPFNWRTQNPFGSIYFAALAGAGELSTGALCQMYLASRSPHSMLVTGFSTEYSKKADSMITFSCSQGKALEALLDSLEKSGDSATIELISEGKNEKGILVCRSAITWSFKRK